MKDIYNVCMCAFVLSYFVVRLVQYLSLPHQQYCDRNTQQQQYGHSKVPLARIFTLKIPINITKKAWNKAMKETNEKKYQYNN